MKKPELCDGCAYAAIGRGYCPADPIKPGAASVVWGEAPGVVEITGKNGYPPRGFTGPAGLTLRNAAKLAGFSGWGYDIVASNVVRCQPPGNKFPGLAVAQECMRRHGDLAEFEKLPMLACGVNAIEALTGIRLVSKAKNAAITDVRGTWLPTAKGWIVATVHPSFIMRGAQEDGPMGKAQSAFFPLLAADLRRVLASRGPIIPTIKMSTPEAVLAAWRGLAVKPEVVSIDVEGDAGNLALCGLGWEPGEAWVMLWSPAARRTVDAISREATPLYHYGTHDSVELAMQGVFVPDNWHDSINAAALSDPSVKAGLESQVLTHVTGSMTWKGLVDHEHGPEYEGPRQRFYRGLWTTALQRAGRRVPRGGVEWYVFYNGLDVAWTLGLFNALKAATARRWQYYETVMRPLQPRLVEMGEAGMPLDLDRLTRHRRACERLERMAAGILAGVGTQLVETELAEVRRQIEEHVAAREAAPRGAYARAKELSALQAKRRALEARAEKFNPNSSAQKCALLYDWFGLEPVLNESGNPTADEDAIERRMSQLVRKTIKPKRGTPEEVLRVMRALLAHTKWGMWRRNFLSPGSEKGDD